MLGQHSPRDWRAESQTRETGHAVDSDPERLVETSSGRKGTSKASLRPSSVPSEDTQSREDRDAGRRSCGRGPCRGRRDPQVRGLRAENRDPGAWAPIEEP